jgi:hypothetical protein
MLERACACAHASRRASARRLACVCADGARGALVPQTYARGSITVGGAAAAGSTEEHRTDASGGGAQARGAAPEARPLQTSAALGAKAFAPANALSTTSSRL